MSQLESVTWDLSHLLAENGAEATADFADIEAAKREVNRLLDEAEALSSEFASAHEGRVGELDADGLRTAMRQLTVISELGGRALNYAHLRFAADTEDPANGALLQASSERATAIQTKLLFFELEWVKVPDERAEELLAAPDMEFCAHHLRLERRYRDHLLSQPEEKLMTELSVTGAGAWDRLFDELMSAIRVATPGEDEPEPLDSALSRLAHPDRAVRRGVAEAITEALQPGLRTRVFIFNTLLQDKAIKDRLRSYPNWLAARNLSNEASDESVQALISAVKGRYDLPRRWYRVKARLLGVERLADYDRMASLGTDDTVIEWADGREIVQGAFDSLSPEAGRVIERFFEERWIDAPPAPGKRGGAFSAGTVPSVHPYVLLNYTDRRRDVLTLAHELGHGLHQFLARDQGVFHHHTPLTVAETASVFAEELVFGRLLAATEDPASRLALLGEAVEGQIATIFRQVAMNQFEDRIHGERREHGELSADRFGELWVETQAEMLGDSVEITENYSSWWSYVPHFVGSPGYVYAYAFGQLLALSVYRLYEERGEEIVPGYLDMLAAGGSRSPEDLAAMVGVNLADPSFWDRGLDLVESQLAAAEAAANATL